MIHQEGQPEELVVYQTEQETIREELLEAVTGGGIKDLFRCCLRPQTQETPPGSPRVQQTPAGPSTQQSLTGVWHPAERRFLTQNEFNAAYGRTVPQSPSGSSSSGSSSSGSSSHPGSVFRLEEGR
jgi:hypothetical protein